MKFFTEILNLIRVKQWVKNLFLFLPVFFAQKILEPDYLFPTIAGFFAYSFIASCIYIINDYFDREKDRLHPKKKYRPLAAKTISVPIAFTVFGILLILGFTVAFFLSKAFLLLLVFYAVMNLAYSYQLKHIPILDVSIVSVGFVLRVLAGSLINEIVLSVWILVMTFLLALFIALAKRRDDMIIYLESNQQMRKSIDGYNLEFLNTAMSIMASVTIVAYLMYSISDEVISRLGTENLYFSVVFVIIGIMRYLQIALVEKDSGSPTELLLKDRFLQIVSLLWVLSIGYLLYFQ